MTFYWDQHILTRIAHKIVAGSNLYSSTTIKIEDGFLSEVQFREMVTDIHKNEGQEEIDRIVTDGMSGNESPKAMNYNEFSQQSGKPSIRRRETFGQI